MASNNDTPTGGIYPLLGILTFVIYPVSIAFKFRYPLFRTILPAGMIAAGLVLLAVSLFFFSRFSKVLDYEPVRFWGRRSTGIAARKQLMQIGVSGGWLLVVGCSLKMF